MAGGAEWRVKIQKISNKVQKNIYISSISNGLMALMPILILGAIFSLINALKIEAYQAFLESSGLKTYTSMPMTVTTDLIALYATFSIAYNFATQKKQQGFSAGILALMGFLLVTPKGLLDDGATAAIGYSWLGAKGLFVAIIVALLVGTVYVFVLEKKVLHQNAEGRSANRGKIVCGANPRILDSNHPACSGGYFPVDSLREYA